jgi:uncharacterized membrane protein YgcG
MSHRLVTLLSFLWLVLPAAALPAATPKPPAATFEFGSRPATAVLDQPGILSAARLAEITAELEKARTQEGLDVIVVILKSLDDPPPEQVAQRFAEAWCNPLFHSVVLYVPGDPAGLRIVPGGKLLRLFSPEAVRETVAQAQRRAACELKEEDQVRAAATEAADMLRILASDGAYWTAQRNAPLQQRNRLTWLGLPVKTVLLPVAGSLLLALALAVGTWLVVRRSRNNRRREFPEPVWKIRLGAPYAGGNGSSVVL